MSTEPFKVLCLPHIQKMAGVGAILLTRLSIARAALEIIAGRNVAFRHEHFDPHCLIGGGPVIPVGSERRLAHAGGTSRKSSATVSTACIFCSVGSYRAPFRRRRARSRLALPPTRQATRPARCRAQSSPGCCSVFVSLFPNPRWCRYTASRQVNRDLWTYRPRTTPGSAPPAPFLR